MADIVRGGRSSETEQGRTHLSHIFDLLAALGGKTSPVEHLEEDLFRVREGYHNYRLDPVEAEHPATNFRESAPSSELELTYFARELQRTQLIGHFVQGGFEIPVHYGITGAIILKRENRRFKAWHQPKLLYSLLVPFKYIENKSLIENFPTSPGLQIVDTGGDRPEYTQLRIEAVRHSHRLTQQLREELYQRWRTEEGADARQVMVASGMSVDTPNTQLTQNFVAISEQVYLPWQNAEVLERQLQLKPYQRGQVLKITKAAGDDQMPKYTWFVRLRSSAKADPEFGLLRCTCIAGSDAEATQRADKLTSRIIEERLPVTFPAEGWDKLIFPVKLCRDYLESLIPTRDTVKSYFARD